jgi:hypothetical protein
VYGGGSGAGAREKTLGRKEGWKTRHAAPCAHPGCDRPATEVAVVESAWEDTATGSALMVCSEHADRYLARRLKEHPRDEDIDGPSPPDPMLRAHRRGTDG